MPEQITIPGVYDPATGSFVINPTFTEGEWTISINGGPSANLDTLPVAVGPASADVLVTLSDDERVEGAVISYVDADGDWIGPELVVTAPEIVLSGRDCNLIEICTGEAITIERSVTDSDGNPVDLSGQSLTLKAWDRARNELFNVSATGTPTGFSASIPSQDKQILSSEWAVRNAAGLVLASGPFIIRAKP